MLSLIFLEYDAEIILRDNQVIFINYIPKKNHNSNTIELSNIIKPHHWIHGANKTISKHHILHLLGAAIIT